jgi:hypothetical protein
MTLIAPLILNVMNRRVFARCVHWYCQLVVCVQQPPGLLLAELDNGLGLLADSARGLKGANGELAFGDRLWRQTSSSEIWGIRHCSIGAKTCTLSEEASA